MNDISRREALSKMAAGSASVGLMLGVDQFASGQGSTQTPATTGDAQTARAFRGQHQPRPLTFDPARLKGLSEKLIRSHWENNYGGAVQALKAVEPHLGAMLKVKDLPPYMYGDLKREEPVRRGA